MPSFFASCFRNHKVFSGDIVELSEPESASKSIYRDELCEKQSPIKQKNYYGYSFSSTKPLPKVKAEEDTKRSTGFDGKANSMRVKVKMTKQEAAQLLSKCKDGGILEFRDVALVLVDLPVNRVNVVSPCPGSNAVLDSIPEEY
ncbi:hypothetical protein DITRI_Ditri04bG0140800 [Diplodiscus trichospermus]